MGQTKSQVRHFVRIFIEIKNTVNSCCTICTIEQPGCMPGLTVFNNTWPLQYHLLDFTISPDLTSLYDVLVSTPVTSHPPPLSVAVVQIEVNGASSLSPSLPLVCSSRFYVSRVVIVLPTEMTIGVVLYTYLSFVYLNTCLGCLAVSTIATGTFRSKNRRILLNPHACWLVAARQSGRNLGEKPNLPAHFGDNLILRYLLFFCLKSTAVQTGTVP